MNLVEDGMEFFFNEYSSFLLLSIEFDRDCEYFAIAGVTKKIKVRKTIVVNKVDNKSTIYMKELK